jgi:hypothetical protein
MWCPDFGHDLSGVMGRELMVVLITQKVARPALLLGHKLEELPAVRVWLEAGNAVEVHAWGKRGARGRRKMWTCRRVVLTLAELPPAGLCSDTRAR